MNFLTSALTPLVNDQRSVGITNLLSTVTSRPGSHKGGGARLLKRQLNYIGFDHVNILSKDGHDPFDCDILIIDMGFEYNGSVNVFGGFGPNTLEHLERLAEFRGQVFSYRNQLPLLYQVLKGRELVKSTCPAAKRAIRNGLLLKVDSVLDKAQVFEHVYQTTKLMFCDSHGPAFWSPEYMLNRADGRTLYGALLNDNQGRCSIEKAIPEWRPVLTEVAICLGSIDIRHHLGRQPDPSAAINDLIFVLYTVLREYNCDITICHPIPIESEQRRIPNTGHYKGTPFYGSWAERHALRQQFVHNIHTFVQKTSNWKELAYPKYFCNKQGELLTEFMERPQSVHISPEFYRTNLDTGQRRWENAQLDKQTRNSIDTKIQQMRRNK